MATGFQVVKAVQDFRNQAKTPQAPTPPKVQPLGGLPPTSGQPPAPQSPPTTSGLPAFRGVQMTPTNPAQDLRSQTFAVGPTADRNQLAQQAVQTWNTQGNPQFEADTRTIARAAGGAGQLGSGQFRTSLGNLALSRDIQRNAQQQSFLRDALNDSIEDQYRNLGIAQNERAYQTGLQSQTFNQGLQLAGLEDQLLNSQLGRSGTLLSLSDSARNRLDRARGGLSDLYGRQSEELGSGLAGLIGNYMNANTAQNSLDSLRQLLGY